MLDYKGFSFSRALAVATLLMSNAGAPALAQEGATTAELITRAMAGDHRSDKNKARDQYRHPAATLAFFGLEKDMSVVEIYPGGGWYTEILAPVLRDSGTFYVAGFDRDSDSDYMKRAIKRFEEKLAADPGIYGKLVWNEFGKQKLKVAEPESLDMVLTFRNVHSVMGGGYAKEAFAAMYAALKPGGILGVVEHRGEPGVEQDPEAGSGYVREDYTIDLVESVGFKLTGGSGVNDNPKDTKDYFRGVWTLPPTLTLKILNRDKYLEIGESDRFTLKFRKPAN